MTNDAPPAEGLGLHPLTGRVDPSRVHALSRRVTPEVLKGYRDLRDSAGTVSDVLDDLGLPGCIGAGRLRPTMPSASIVGTAITLRNLARSESPYAIATRHDVRMEELEGINQGEPGDVLVISGVPGISNMGGMMATIAKRQQLSGSVVDGGVRDVGQSRRIDYPMWSTDVSPITGKWRAETVEVNGDVVICGVRVQAGDLVVADETGVCFVPFEHAEEVLERAQAAVEKERHYHADIAAGLTVPELALKYKPPRP
jgi:4-hydroxy-4-methyl-2-oxoglutarate aldolase